VPKEEQGTIKAREEVARLVKGQEGTALQESK
jgi:hypothetical protein